MLFPLIEKNAILIIYLFIFLRSLHFVERKEKKGKKKAKRNERSKIIIVIGSLYIYIHRYSGVCAWCIVRVLIDTLLFIVAVVSPRPQRSHIHRVKPPRFFFFLAVVFALHTSVYWEPYYW